MAPGQDTDDDSNELLLGRRSALKMAGAFAFGGAALGAAGRVSAATGEFGQVVDLGEQGLSPGDEIDPYIEEHFQSGNEVHVPPGEYEWNGSLDGPSDGDAALIGDGNVGDVVFNVNATLGGSFENSSGTVLVRNITFSGSNPDPKAGFELAVGDGAEFRLEHVRVPDGAQQEEDRFLYASRDHDGIAYVRNCYWRGFANNGAYTDNGRVIYENCVAHNNNIAGIRIGTGDSEVYNSLIIIDESPPTDGANSSNGRGIRMREPGTHVIENCDFVYRDVDGAASPIELRADETAGVLRNCRILNETDEPVVRNKSSSADWTAENVHVSGGGNLEMEGVDEADVTRGDGATPPRTDFAEFLGAPIDQSASDGTSSGSADTGPITEYENTLVLHSDPDNPDDENCDVSVTVTGEATWGAEAESSSDTIDANDDGTTTITSVGLDPDALDSYKFNGEAVDYSITDGYSVDVSLNGTTMSLAELVGEDTDDSGSTSDSTSDSTTDSGTSDDSTDSTTDSTTDGDTSDVTSPTDGDSADSDTSGSGSSDSGSTDSDVTTGGASDPLPHLVTVDGSELPAVCEYTFTVTGDVVRAPGYSEGGALWDDMEDIAKDGKVVGVVHEGVDAYWVSGDLTSVSFNGDAELSIQRDRR